MSSQEKKNVTGHLYNCMDCGGVWDNTGVEIFVTNNVSKYVCKECRGRCISKEEVGKIKGVKSIRQNFKRSKLPLISVILVLCFLTFEFYERRVTIQDYRNYLIESASVRKTINTKLESFRDDIKIVEKLEKEKTNPKKLRDAKIRVAEAKRFILAMKPQIDKIDKPDKEEVIELYDVEMKFWNAPNYKNYITYTGYFSTLKNKYGSDLFELLKDQVRKHLTKKHTN